VRAVVVGGWRRRVDVMEAKGGRLGSAMAGVGGVLVLVLVAVVVVVVAVVDGVEGGFTWGEDWTWQAAEGSCHDSSIASPVRRRDVDAT
jgi:hypothetical protein